MTKGALGLYDSGIGGKTILKEIRKIFPDIEIHYLADTKNFPLGNKTKSEIKEITKVGVEYLFDKGCVIIILACNTASVNSIRYLQQNWIKKHYPNRKILGVSIPLTEYIRDHYYHSNNSNIAILSTPSTHRNGFYLNSLKKIGFRNIKSIPCPDLAQTIESGNKKNIKNKLHRLFEGSNSWTNYQFVVLACTHYPIIINDLKNIFKNAVFIDQAKATAEKLKTYLKKHKEFDLKAGKTYFWKT